MSAEQTDKLLMQPWPGRAGHPLSAWQPSAALFTQGGAGGENRRIEGGRGMVNDNNAVGDQTVTLPSPAWLTGNIGRRENQVEQTKYLEFKLRRNIGWRYLLSIK